MRMQDRRRSSSAIGLTLALLALAACGDDDGAAVPTPTATPVPTSTPSPSPEPTSTPLDFVATASDFECLLNWPRVRNLRINNSLGFLDEALELARNPIRGEEFPVGTIVQLFPGEAMVKRGPAFDPANNNWEYFELRVSAEGTEINVRGRDDVVNMFGGQCFGCHEAARDFDFLCDKGRGCVVLPIDETFVDLLQNNDPRCD